MDRQFSPINQPEPVAMTGGNGSDRQSHESTATHPNHPRHPSHPRLNFARSATPANRDQGPRVMSPNIASPLPALPSLSSFPSVQTLLVDLSPRNPAKNLSLPGFHPVVDCRYPAPAVRRSGSPSYRKKSLPPATANTSGSHPPAPVLCSSYSPNSETRV